jgi:hypothetical protein
MANNADASILAAMDAVFHVCAYLVQHKNVGIVFDPNCHAVDMCAFIKTDWNFVYWVCEGIDSFWRSCFTWEGG